MTKRILTAFLALVMCIACIPVSSITGAAAVYSSAVYMIFTNPGEDCNSQMRIGWHSDADNTNCYVMYTTADDTDFSEAVRVDGTYDDQAYKWFYNRLTTNAVSESRFDKVFLDWGVELDNLTPDTDYIYRVYDGEGLYSKNYKFKTGGADQYSIIWMSDAHVNSTYSARLIDWRKMVMHGKASAKYPVAFQFFTGDNVTSGDRYADWLSIANESFTRDYMFASVVGNHDVYDGIMYADQEYYTQYWKSGEYFRIVNNNPENGFTYTSQRISGYLETDGLTQYTDRPSNELIEYGDDGKLCTGAVDNTDGRFYWFNYNGLLFIIFEYYSMMFDGDAQAAIDWAGEVIKQNEGKYDYIICSNHINLIWGGDGTMRDYGSTDYEVFGKLFDEYNVDIFLAGDNHIYLRTDSIFNGAVNTDPEKGTYIVQAPCISRPQSATLYDGAGFAVKQYSLSGKTVGGLVIDVDENGLTFTCLTKEEDRDPQYGVYESFTIPKKTRSSNRLTVNDGAKFTANSKYLNAPEGLTVQDIIDGIGNDSVVVTDLDGNALPATATVTAGMTVTVRNDGFTYAAATMTVKTASAVSALLGDVNGDGNVNSIDAALILKYAAGTVDGIENGDMNGDGAINSIDAALILKQAAGL